jgi:hypothetical protein
MDASGRAARGIARWHGGNLHPSQGLGWPFGVNRAHAEQAGGAWLALSAKYGFLRPDDLVPGPYDVTFKRKSSNPINVSPLRDQVAQMGLDRSDAVVGLGGKDCRDAVAAAFVGTTLKVTFPFAGPPIGPAMRAIKAATAPDRRPRPDRRRAQRPPPAPPMNSSHALSSSLWGASKSQSREWFSSAMNPSRVHAVKY